MTNITETPDPDGADGLQDANLQGNQNQTQAEDENPEQLVGDEISPEEEAALEQDDTRARIAEAPGSEEIPEGTDDTGQDTDTSGTRIAGEVETEDSPGGIGGGRRRIRWYLAPCLRRLMTEVNRRWPYRDRSSDGTIGDRRHRGRFSDHKPNRRRSVNACDIDKDGIRIMVVIRAAIRHPSTNYVIYKGIIWARAYGFRPRRYTGIALTAYIHISIMQTRAAEQSRRHWGIWPR